MGQQQLLLVILVTIIVGIATVVAINTFGTAADQANIDAVTNDVATLASAAQGFYMRPEMLGGGGRTFDGLSFHGLAFPANAIDGVGEVAQNENGRYVLSGTDGQSFTITAHPSSCNGYAPGAITEVTDGPNTLDGGSDCDEEDRIIADVSPNDFDLDPSL